MTKLGAWKTAGAVLVLWAAPTGAAAQTFHTLIELVPANGISPGVTLIQGVDGNIYGTMPQGGSGLSCCGTVVQIQASGKLLNIDFKKGGPIDPGASLVLATDGNFYGTTENGGAHDDGTVFKVSRQGKITTVYSFCAQVNCTDGANPPTGLVEGRDGNFYGATITGGATCSDGNPGGCGTVFRVTPHGTLTTLHTFTGPEGSSPLAGLVQGYDGSFYGTTVWGGTSTFCQDSFGCGTVFKMTPSGQLTTIYNFCSQPNCTDGEHPEAALIEGTDGNFYGTTISGGVFSEGYGTVFTLTSTGSLTTLHVFTDGKDGGGPAAALVQGTDGNFYGTTADGSEGYGTVFSMTPTGTLLPQHAFTFNDGAYPYGGLLQATSGIFYGTTIAGGIYKSDCRQFQGCGTVFTLSMNLPPFVSLIRNPAKVGQSFGILGQGFTGSTNVVLNGTPATFKVKSDTLLAATVPAGATTGYVAVTTPSGTLTSNVPFHVIP